MALIATPHADVARMLSELGHQVLATADPAEATRADMVVVPWVNRPISGPAWCRQLRERAPRLPVLAVTRTDKEALEALEVGVSDVVRHPLLLPVLKARCGALLRAAAPSATPLTQAAHAARILDTLPEAVLAVDAQGQIRLFNRGAERLLGLMAAEVVGQLALGDLFSGAADAERLDLELRSSKDLALVERRARMRSADGERVPVVLNMARLSDAEGAPLGVVLSARDDRDQAALAERLSNATQQLLATEKRLAGLSAAVASAHEINQPLATVMGLLELMMMRPELGQDGREKLERAWAQLERIADKVRKLGQAAPSAAWPQRVGG